MFAPSNATSLSFSLHLPTLDETTTCEYRDLPEPVLLPGCVPLHGIDLLDPVQDRSSDSYKAFLNLTKQLHLADGIILNSFLDMEEGAIKSLLEEKSGRPPIYPVGPIIQTGSKSDPDQPECLAWLDGQPSKSVLFVSFGSGGTLSSAQVTELALGLEASKQRFLWVVRTPNEKASNGAFFDAQTPNDPLSYLPEGFLGRTKDQGLVVPFWAPQIEVLSHGSVGGFVTHCGWNSVQESVTLGVPLIAWPLYAEQKMNAVMLTEGVKVALKLKKNESGVVERDEIAKVVRSLMEDREDGKKVREKAMELKDAAKKAWSEDGSSAKSLAQLASKWNMD